MLYFVYSGPLTLQHKNNSVSRWQEIFSKIKVRGRTGSPFLQTPSPMPCQWLHSLWQLSVFFKFKRKWHLQHFRQYGSEIHPFYNMKKKMWFVSNLCLIVCPRLWWLTAHRSISECVNPWNLKRSLCPHGLIFFHSRKLPSPAYQHRNTQEGEHIPSLHTAFPVFDGLCHMFRQSHSPSED